MRPRTATSGRSRYLVGTVAVVVCALTCTLSFAEQDIGPDKKVIAWGMGDATPAYMRQHLDTMERSPMQGVIFHVDAVTPSGQLDFATNFWGPRRFTEDELKPAIDELKATRFTRLTENFLRLNVSPGGVDWFDPEFDAILENARLAAQVVAEGNVRGITFDPEMGSYPVWVYGGQKYHATKSFDEYRKQVRLRGRQFMQAIQSAWPSPVIHLTWAWSQVAMDPAPGVQMSGYGLLPSFLDGWLDVANPGAIIIDGFEGSYTYRDNEEFVKARKVFTDAAETVSNNTPAYREHVRLGFGLWIDQGIGSFPWDLEDPYKSKLSPLEFEFALHRALAHSDGYVWIFGGAPNWWTNEKLPPAYVQAVLDARKSHDPAWKTDREIPGGRDVIALAAATGALEEQETFGPLWDKYDLVMDLPRVGWLFRTDPKRQGESEKWYEPDTDTSTWRTIEIVKFWTEQGYPNYHGAAWYRCALDIPASLKGKKLLLSFGGVDETAVVYVNGLTAGAYGLLGYTWHDRFEIDVTPLLRAGESNVIAVRVEDTTGVAGIWKPVKLITPKG